MATALVREIARAFAPPPRLKISEWAEEHRYLPESSAARGARWRNATAPYLVGIMDASLERGVRLISVVKAAQTGVSESLTNLLCYFMQHRPTSMLFVLPTMEGALTFSKDRLADVIRRTPELRDVVTDDRRGESGLPQSTLTVKMFPGGSLTLACGNSPNSYAQRAARIAIADDADRIPAYVGVEGDPTQLLINRTTTYPDGLAIFVSTPVLAGGRIESLYRQSDQRRYHVECPDCRSWNWITWRDETHWRVVFDEHRPETARLVCTCGYPVIERDRMALIRGGHWQPTERPLAAGNVGFHVPAMLSPFVTLERLTAKFLSAHLSGAPRRLKEFVTTQLGEGWKDEAIAVEAKTLEDRMEDY